MRQHRKLLTPNMILLLDLYSSTKCRFYKIRITGAKNQPISAAVPARCLHSGEKLVAMMTASGELAGLSYDLSGVGTSFNMLYQP